MVKKKKYRRPNNNLRILTALVLVVALVGLGIWVFFLRAAVPSWTGNVFAGTVAAPAQAVADATAAGGSAVQFKTAPVGGGFKFAAYEDTKGGQNVLQSVSGLAKTFNPAFQVYAGDLCAPWSTGCMSGFKNAYNGGNNNGLYDRAFFTRGNHDCEGNSTDWQNYFNFAGIASNIGATNFSTYTKNQTYSFDYGSANDKSHVVGIDDCGDNTSIAPGAITWADADIKAAETRGAVHTFLFFHGPLWYVDEHSSSSSGGLVNLINNHPSVTAMFNGHEHVTSYIHLNNHLTLNHPVEEFVAGDAGAGQYKCSSGRIASGENCWGSGTSPDGIGFILITVNGRTVKYDFYHVGQSSPVKSWTLTKP